MQICANKVCMCITCCKIYFSSLSAHAQDMLQNTSRALSTKMSTNRVQNSSPPNGNQKENVNNNTSQEKNVYTKYTWSKQCTEENSQETDSRDIGINVLGVMDMTDNVQKVNNMDIKVNVQGKTDMKGDVQEINSKVVELMPGV